MQTNSDKTLKELQALAKEHLQMLGPHNTYTGRFSVNYLYVNGYRELFFTLRALMNVCIMALENEDYSNSPLMQQPGLHIQTVLELASKMMPFEEGELLDGMRQLLLDENAAGPSQKPNACPGPIDPNP